MKKLTKNSIKKILQPRKASSHKGSHGHALLIAGSMGKMGAAVIAARACLRSGCGLLTINIPYDERFILQTTIPEAMLAIREKDVMDFSKFSAAGIGPGIGTTKDSAILLKQILSAFKKQLIIDADALNIIAADKILLDKLSAGTILTPHPKEFDRLFGNHTSTESRMNKAIEKAREYNIVIVLKGHHTLITNGAQSFLNATGNAGLAKGGSGDALTGIVCSFLAQGYKPLEAAAISVYLHGLAADITLKNQSMESMLITDVIECLGEAFIKVRK